VMVLSPNNIHRVAVSAHPNFAYATIRTGGIYQFSPKHRILGSPRTFQVRRLGQPHSTLYDKGQLLALSDSYLWASTQGALCKASVARRLLVLNNGAHPRQQGERQWWSTPCGRPNAAAATGSFFIGVQGNYRRGWAYYTQHKIGQQTGIVDCSSRAFLTGRGIAIAGEAGSPRRFTQYALTQMGELWSTVTTPKKLMCGKWSPAWRGGPVLKQVVVGGPMVWGVGDDDRLYYRQNSTTSWQKSHQEQWQKLQDHLLEACDENNPKTTTYLGQHTVGQCELKGQAISGTNFIMWRGDRQTDHVASPCFACQLPQEPVFYNQVRGAVTFALTTGGHFTHISMAALCLPK